MPVGAVSVARAHAHAHECVRLTLTVRAPPADPDAGILRDRALVKKDKSTVSLANVFLRGCRDWGLGFGVCV